MYLVRTCIHVFTPGIYSLKLVMGMIGNIVTLLFLNRPQPMTLFLTSNDSHFFSLVPSELYTCIKKVYVAVLLNSSTAWQQFITQEFSEVLTCHLTKNHNILTDLSAELSVIVCPARYTEAVPDLHPDQFKKHGDKDCYL